MKNITHGYLKWYYGYKNFGDELLALWVIQYLFTHYPLEVLYIEVWDCIWFEHWLQTHKEFLWDNLCKVKCISKNDKLSIIRYSILDPKVHKFLWWWEVFAPARGWFHGWRNMYILYMMAFWRKNVTLLGWISKATSRCYRLLYRLTIPNCASLILREKISYSYIIQNYPTQNHVILYHDFWYDVITSPLVQILTEQQLTSKTWLQCPYILVNMNPYIDMSTLTELLSTLTQWMSSQNLVYFSCDEEDKPIYDMLSVNVWQHKLTSFDWTKYDISTVVSVYVYTLYGVWVRLHFLALLYWLHKEYHFVVYQEKIQKFFDQFKD